MGSLRRDGAERRFYDRPVRWGVRLPFILLIPVCAALQWFAARSPGFVDAYSGTVYPIVARALAAATGWLPISIAEIVLLLFVLGLLFALWRNVRRVRRKSRHLLNWLVHTEVDGLALLGVVYLLFLLWGLNYHRTPLATRAGYDTAPPTVAELRALCSALIEETNAARLGVREDGDGVMRLDDTPRASLTRAWLGFHRAAQLHDPLAGGYAGNAKGFALLSTPMSYVGLDGIYVMLSGEPSVNLSLPEPVLPFVTCHEISHQVGWAREEEASFAGWLACAEHPHADFRYSARFGALRWAMAALHRADPPSHAELLQRCSPEVLQDWNAVREFRERHETWATHLGSRFNDLYLKSQGQEAGADSYGMMVDLLIAHRRRQPASSF